MLRVGEVKFKSAIGACLAMIVSVLILYSQAQYWAVLYAVERTVDQWFAWTGLGSSVLRLLMPLLHLFPFVVAGTAAALVFEKINPAVAGLVLTGFSLQRDVDFGWPGVAMIGSDCVGCISYSSVLFSALVAFLAITAGFSAAKQWKCKPQYTNSR